VSSSPSARFPDNLPPGWKERLAAEKDKDYFKALTSFLSDEYKKGAKVYPARENVLRALREVDFDDVKVVILGQDPYHGAGQAIGLSFAVPNELMPKPPSLGNIFKEISSDIGVDMRGKPSDLSGWVEQGVLLLNTVLTVRASQAFSHRDKGWEQFTDKVIAELGARRDPVVFLLWGSPARKKKALIKSPLILESPHPSPLSASSGFFGCRHFSKANKLLEQEGKQPIDWARSGK
jgi:uracil-DNA glycosylase